MMKRRAGARRSGSVPPRAPGRNFLCGRSLYQPPPFLWSACETKKAPLLGGCANAVRKRSLGAAEPPHCLFSFNYFLRPIAPAAATRAITA